MTTHSPALTVLRRPAVEERTGLSRSSIYSMMSKGTFPKPIRLGERAVGWRASDIEQWLTSRDRATGDQTCCFAIEAPGDAAEHVTLSRGDARWLHRIALASWSKPGATGVPADVVCRLQEAGLRLEQRKGGGWAIERGTTLQEIAQDFGGQSDPEEQIES